MDDLRTQIDLEPAWLITLTSVVMFCGIFLWIWYAGYAAGFVPFPDLLVFKPLTTTVNETVVVQGGTDHRLLIYILALLSISEYFGMQLLFSALRRRMEGREKLSTEEVTQVEELNGPRTRVIIRCVCAASVWIYMLVLYMILP